ncbi:hypothetical protein Tco_1381940, partial [Tanacetum coccineum]
PDHVDDLPVVESNQPDVVPIIPEPVLVGEDEDLEEEELKEEEEPQEEEDMDIDDEEDKNEPELTFPYEKVDPLNPPTPASDSEPKDVIEVEDTVKPEDETVPASVHEVGESSTATFLQEDGDSLLPGFMRRDTDSLFVLSSVEEGATAMENLVRMLGNAEEKAECKKLKKELEEARIMPPKSAPMTQAAIERMITSRINAALTADRARRDIISGPGGSGQGRAPTARECTFAGFIKCNPTVFRGTKGAVELRRWFEKTKSVFGISGCAEGKKVKFVAATLQGPALTWWNSKVAILGLDVANQMGLTEMKKLMTAEFCLAEEVQRMEHELWNLKVKEYNIGEVTSSRPANLNEAMRMAHKLMEQELQARNERILKGNKRKWENFQSGNSSGKRNHKDNSCQSL